MVFSMCCSTQSISRGLSRSDHRAAYYYYYYYTIGLCPGERPVLRVIMPSGPNYFFRNLPHTREHPTGDFNALVTCRDDAAAAPRAIIAAVSRAYLYYYYYCYHHRWIGDFAYVSGAF